MFTDTRRKHSTRPTQTHGDIGMRRILSMPGFALLKAISTLLQLWKQLLPTRFRPRTFIMVSTHAQTLRLAERLGVWTA